MDPMDYISAREAAAKWGTHLRVVQELCKQGRVPGAKKFGAAWLVPAGVGKPLDPRRARRDKILGMSGYLPCAVLGGVLPLPRDPGEEEKFMQSLEEDLRDQYAAELAYLRGDCDTLKARFRATPPGARTFLCACTAVQSAAISSGDWPVYSSAAGLLKHVMRASSTSGLTAEAGFLTAAISMFDASHVPLWLSEGDFSAFPVTARPWAVYIHVKYLQNLRDFRSMLDVARTALALCSRPGRFTPMEIYLRLGCAAACYGLGDWAGMAWWLSEAMADALPWGFIMPFAETILAYGDVMERQVADEWPQYHQAIAAAAAAVSKNWLSFHNHFARDNIALVLSVQEYRLAQLLVADLSYEEIAERMNLSKGRVRNIVSGIYAKLHIKRRKRLNRFIL